MNPGAELQITDHQHRNQCCSNLDAHGIGRRTDEGFDLELLLEQLEEQYDLPALLGDGGDGGSAQGEVVGQQH